MNLRTDTLWLKPQLQMLLGKLDNRLNKRGR